MQWKKRKLQLPCVYCFNGSGRCSLSWNLRIGHECHHAQVLQGSQAAWECSANSRLSNRQDADPIRECLLTCPGSPLSRLIGCDWSPEQCSWIQDKLIHVAVERTRQACLVSSSSIHPEHWPLGAEMRFVSKPLQRLLGPRLCCHLCQLPRNVSVTFAWS